MMAWHSHLVQAHTRPAFVGICLETAHLRQAGAQEDLLMTASDRCSGHGRGTALAAVRLQTTHH
jgi:hypothetical protein